MKTAMQELLERVREYRDLETSLIAISRLNSVYVDILGMLEKEKEQIMNAYYDGGRFPSGVGSNEYYDKTFNTKEK